MNLHAQQLVRLAELLDVGAEVVRDLTEAHDFGPESRTLDRIAGDLEQVALRLRGIGFGDGSSRSGRLADPTASIARSS